MHLPFVHQHCTLGKSIAEAIKTGRRRAQDGVVVLGGGRQLLSGNPTKAFFLFSGNNEITVGKTEFPQYHCFL